MYDVKIRLGERGKPGREEPMGKEWDLGTCNGQLDGENRKKEERWGNGGKEGKGEDGNMEQMNELSEER